MTLSKLQNGSDIRGISLTGIPGEDPNLTPAQAGLLTKGFLIWLCKKTGKEPEEITLSIGRDPRLSGKLLQRGVVNALGPYGVRVLDCGLASTPAMFMSTVFPEYNCDGAIMITASHLPFNRNGFKYFCREGGLDKKDIEDIIHFAQGTFSFLGTPMHKGGSIRDHGVFTYPSTPTPLMETYSKHLRQIICIAITGSLDPKGQQPLSGLKIAVDAGNGSGGFYAKQVLKPLGADISAGLYLEPDGSFPNHAPNPEDPQALAQISMAVLATGADLGLIFDTDVDRCAAIDNRGIEIARDGIVALASALVAEKHPGSTVVTDSITSDELTVFLEHNLGLNHFRYMRGYKNVINKARSISDSWLAIETSGHAAFRENNFLDDGAYLATLIVIKAAIMAKDSRPLSNFFADFHPPLESAEVRLKVGGGNFSAVGDDVLEQLSGWVATNPLDMTLAKPNYEGVRISFPHGWCLLRKSLHDPIMPLNVASNKVDGVKEILKSLTPFLSQFSLVDTTPLESYMD